MFSQNVINMMDNLQLIANIILAAIVFILDIIFKQVSKRHKNENKFDLSTIEKGLICVAFFALFNIYFFVYSNKILLLIIIVLLFLAAIIIILFYKKKLMNTSNDELMEAEIKKISEGKSSKYTTLDVVIAVSAILLTNENKFILVKKKEHGNWVQPGTYYRTNKISESTSDLSIFNNDTPLNLLLDTINVDIGLFEGSLDLIDLHHTEIVGDIQTFSVVSENDRYLINNTLRGNKLTPAPFLIQYEKSNEEKGSGKTVHIDLFYAFVVKEGVNYDREIVVNGKKYTNAKAYSLEEVRGLSADGVTYSDLYILCHKFIEYYRSYLYKFSGIRYCTFNPQNNTIWFRMNTNCNLKCKYCLLGSKVCGNHKSNLKISAVLSALEENKSLFTANNYKFVFTGGEPFLVSNIMDVVLNTVSSPVLMHKIFSISICTNGTLCESTSVRNKILDLARSLRNKDIQFKFTINLSAFDEETYDNLMRQGQFSKSLSFIQFLNYNEIDFTIDVVMTSYLKNHLLEYVHFWKKNGIRKIAFSYGIKNELNKNANLLSRDECIKIYRSLYNGQYPIEHFQTLELMIPSCNDPYCNSNHIIAIEKEENIFKVRAGCLDRQNHVN